MQCGLDMLTIMLVEGLNGCLAKASQVQYVERVDILVNEEIFGTVLFHRNCGTFRETSKRVYPIYW
jgi:hypothetical protein